MGNCTKSVDLSVSLPHELSLVNLVASGALCEIESKSVDRLHVARDGRVCIGSTVCDCESADVRICC